MIQNLAYVVRKLGVILYMDTDIESPAMFGRWTYDHQSGFVLYTQSGLICVLIANHVWE